MLEYLSCVEYIKLTSPNYPFAPVPYTGHIYTDAWVNFVYQRKANGVWYNWDNFIDGTRATAMIEYYDVEFINVQNIIQMATCIRENRYGEDRYTYEFPLTLHDSDPPRIIPGTYFPRIKERKHRSINPSHEYERWYLDNTIPRLPSLPETITTDGSLGYYKDLGIDEYLNSQVPSGYIIRCYQVKRSELAESKGRRGYRMFHLEDILRYIRHIIGDKILCTVRTKEATAQALLNYIDTHPDMFQIFD